DWSRGFEWQIKAYPVSTSEIHRMTKLDSFFVFNNTFVDLHYSAVRFLYVDDSLPQVNNIYIKNNLIYNSAIPSGVWSYYAIHFGRRYSTSFVPLPDFDSSHVVVDYNSIHKGNRGDDQININGVNVVQAHPGMDIPKFSVYTEFGAVNDFHLMAGDTAARDHGEDLTTYFLTDIDGMMRLQGKPWDNGAYKYREGNTYYVDFDNGNDANNGLTQATAWKNLPGTQSVDASTALSGTSGWQKIMPGDVIKIKSGTTHDASDGGRILISSTWYAQGTPDQPITITRDQWWGSGQVLIDGAGMTVPSWQALVDIWGLSYIVVDGSILDGIKIANSGYAGFRNYGNNGTLRNAEVFNSKTANVLFSGTEAAAQRGTVIDHVTAHKTNTDDDTASNIYLGFNDGALLSYITAYDGNAGSDGIHLSSSRNSWIADCTVHNNGEQGIDISRDGDNKMLDLSYNNTVIRCVGYDNLKQNFDANSASHDIYFIGVAGWRTTTPEIGDGNVTVYQAGNRVFVINSSLASARDNGFKMEWNATYDGMLPGQYNMYIINSVTTGDGGAALRVEDDSNGYGYNLATFNSIFNSAGINGLNLYGDAAIIKTRRFSRNDINLGANGWSDLSSKATDPLFLSLLGPFNVNNFIPQSGSPLIDAGAFPFVTSGAGAGTVLNLKPLAADLDATHVFRAGDLIQIQGADKPCVVFSVPSATQVILASAAAWEKGQGVWFPWQGARPDIGAFEYVSSVLKGSGDVSGDGRVTMYDAALVVKYTIGGALTTVQQAQADINSDTIIDAADAVAIARKALGL
ncbi:MAG: dockerin type I domain-containing protein, partial [Candidatus Omnitrophota bacterium]